MKEETTPTIDDEQKMNEIIYGYRCFSVPSERGHEEAWPIEAIQKMMTEWASLHQCGGWTSVEDGKPEVEKRVLVFTGMKYPDDIMVGYISKVTGHWFDEEANYLSIPVTHWIPLPTKPNL